MKRVNAYILIVFIGLSSLFIFLTKEAADTVDGKDQKTQTYNTPSDEKPFVYTGIQQDKKVVNKKIKIKFKSKRAKTKKIIDNADLTTTQKVSDKKEEKKATETATVAATKSSDKKEVKLDKDGNPIKEEENEEKVEASNVAYNNYSEDYNYPEESRSNNKQAEPTQTVQAFFAAQPNQGANNAGENNNNEDAEQFAEWSAYLFDSPSLEKFNELLTDLEKNEVSDSVYRNIISEAIATEDTKEFALELLKKTKSSFSFNLLALNYDPNSDSSIEKEMLNEINTYASLENVIFLKSSLQSSDSVVFETSLNVLKNSMDTHLGGRNISSTESELNANEIFASFLPIFNSLDRVFDEDNRLAIFDSIFSSLQALFSNDTPQELTV